MNILDAIVKRVNKKMNRDQIYRRGEYEIIMPSTSRLQEYQKIFPLYDRFLPVLAGHLESGTIIDVGAHTGDTLVAMAHKCSNSFICIEPSDTFFDYLKKNADKIQLKENQNIKLIKKMAGTGNLSGDGSTATIQPTENQVIQSKYIQLDNTTTDYSDIVLIKSDVDGYDFDVIQSSEKILTQSEPILFWENQILDDFQYKEYGKFYDFLEEKGYSNLYIFDNFGNLLVEKSNFKTLRDINAYLYNIEKYKATRTFFYTDILASTEKRVSIIESAVVDYKNNQVRHSVEK